ncbi:MAG: hypothetical protein AB8I08_24480 [Sandaracinaceae bacterium]
MNSPVDAAAFAPPGGAPPGGAPPGGAPPGGGFGAPPGGGGAAPGFGAPPGGAGAPPGAAPAAAPEKKKGGAVKYVLFGCLGLFLLSGCLGGGYFLYGMYMAAEAVSDVADDFEELGEAVQEANEAAEAANAEAGGEAGGGGACSRVAACCRAYVAAMGATVPASTCDAYNDVTHIPEATCSSTIAGYRTGLAAMQKAVPTECN